MKRTFGKAVAFPSCCFTKKLSTCPRTFVNELAIDIVYVKESAAYAVIFRVVCVKARTSEVRASDGF